MNWLLKWFVLSVRNGKCTNVRSQMNNEILIHIISVAMMASSSVGVILVITGKMMQQTLLYLLPSLLFGLIIFIALHYHNWKGGKKYG
jgi:hypothetical protein